MNLQYFPMDRQLCHIEIESCKYHPHLAINSRVERKSQRNLRKLPIYMNPFTYADLKLLPEIRAATAVMDATR